MITVEKCGKIYIPPQDGFIGYAGDNLNKTIKFLLKERNDSDYFYRIYLKFDDDTVNFFVLEKEIQENDTVLYWNITDDQIFKSGIMYLQIKGYDTSGEIFHTEAVPLIVGKSIEFGNRYNKKQISEILKAEKTLDQLYSDIKNVTVLLPYIGENNNWFVYDYDNKTYVDTNVCAKGKIEELPLVFSISQSSDNIHVPTAKAVYDYVDKENTELLLTQIGNLSYLNTEDKTSIVNSINELNSDKEDLQSQIKNTTLRTDMFKIDASVAFGNKMNVLKTSSNTTLSSEDLYQSGTVYVYIPSSVTVIQAGAIDFTNVRLLVIDNSENGINISQANIPSNVKIIYIQDLDTVPSALMKMAYAVSEVFKGYYNKSDSKSRFAQGVSAIYDSSGNVLRTTSNKTLSAGTLYGDPSVETAFIANNVSKIQGGAFAECTNLKTVYIDKPEESISQGNLIIQDNAIPTNAQIIFTDSFNGVTANAKAIASVNKLINSLNFGNKLAAIVAFDENNVPIKTYEGTAVAAGPFTDNEKIVKVFIPSSITNINGGAFANCTNLTEIIIDNVEGAVEIDDDAIPSYTDIVYSNTFNVVTTLYEAVAYLNNIISEFI